MSKLRVRVQPRAKKNALSGFDAEGWLVMRVTAPPVDGAANEAVTRYLADLLRLPTRDIVMITGATTRMKVFDVPLSEDEVRARLR
ncbi:MAG: DUF167 domain-containing protein [Dehalococcoidia bacterium]|nr:DUF167 domain-containing protein [Dehalococcoidia bacterium]